MTLLDVQTSVLDLLPKDVCKEDIPPADDPFFYGWREVPQRTNGTEEWVRVPLTLEDVLHPQLGDVIVQGFTHFKLCKILLDGLESYLAHEPDTVVLSDMRIDWEHQTIKPMGPDSIVIRRTTEVEPDGCFYVKEYGGRVDLVVEVTSPSTWMVDVAGYRTPNKVQLYERLGVRCYIVVEGAKRKKGHPPPISGYALKADGTYRKIEPDKRGWLWVDTIGLWIGPYQNWVSWYDADGNKIGTNVEVNEAHKREAEARQRAEEHAQREAEARQRAEEHAQQEAEARQREADARQRAEEHAQQEAEARQREADARQRAEEHAQQEAEARQREADARQRAEEHAQQEAEARQREADARQRAEEQTRAEAEARQMAEDQARAEAEARQTAEDQARAEADARQREADARQRAEERIRELEALLRMKDEG